MKRLIPFFILLAACVHKEPLAEIDFDTTSLTSVKLSDAQLNDLFASLVKAIPSHKMHGQILRREFILIRGELLEARKLLRAREDLLEGEDVELGITDTEITQYLNKYDGQR